MVEIGQKIGCLIAILKWALSIQQPVCDAPKTTHLKAKDKNMLEKLTSDIALNKTLEFLLEKCVPPGQYFTQICTFVHLSLTPFFGRKTDSAKNVTISR